MVPERLLSVVRKLVLGLVHERDDLLGTLTQAHAVLGEHGRAVRAVKERTAKLALELGDLPRERGLRHMQHVRGLGHALLARHGKKVAKRPELHASTAKSFEIRIAD